MERPGGANVVTNIEGGGVSAKASVNMKSFISVLRVSYIEDAACRRAYAAITAIKCGVAACPISHSCVIGSLAVWRCC